MVGKHSSFFPLSTAGDHRCRAGAVFRSQHGRPSSGVTPTGEGERERGRANKKEQGHVPPPFLRPSLSLEPLVYCFIESAEWARILRAKLHEEGFPRLSFP